MNDIDKIDVIAREDFGHDEVAYAIYKSIRSWLLEDNTIKHVTFLDVRRRLSQELDDPSKVEVVMNYLCGSRIHLLDFLFEYIDDDGRSYVLDSDQVKYAKENDELIHPETNEVISNAKQCILVSFTPNEETLRG